MARISLAALLLTTVIFANLSLSRQSATQESISGSSTDTAKATARITGVVIDDSTGRPLSGATVQLQIVVLHFSCFNCQSLTPPSAPKPEPPRETITGADGSFTFDNVPHRNISITATKQGYFEAWSVRRHPGEPLHIYSAKEQVGPITLRLAPEASITGVLRDHHGNLITKEAYVSLWRLANWAGWPRLEYNNSAEVDADGIYRFRGLRPGHYYLIADPPVDNRKPSLNAEGSTVGEVPLRYPESAAGRSKSFFTLPAGESAQINFQFSQKLLHRVSGVLQMSEPYGYDLRDESGGNAYAFSGSPFEKHFQAWLPAGSYRLSTGREGDVTGPLPFEIKDSDLSDLSFSIAIPARIEVPVEISSVAPNRATCPDPLIPACGFFLADLVRFNPGGYVEVVGESSQTNKAEVSPPRRVESVSLIPGDYTVAVAVTGNVYAKSIVSGATDIAVDPIVIGAGDSPQPIQIVLAEGAMADGIVFRDGKTVRAWVYGVAEDIESKADFRVFQPVASEADGKFRIEGLAPGSYLFFASDIELPLNVHDSAEVDYWRARGKIVRVESGKTTHLVLDFAIAPEVP